MTQTVQSPIVGTQFTASLSFADDIPKVTLAGEADVAALDRLTASLCAAAAANTVRDVHVDAAALTFIDASSIDALVEADVRLRAGGRRLQIVNADCRIARLLHLLDLQRLICSVH